MCLDVVTKRYDPPIREERWARKVFKSSEQTNDLWFEWQLLNGNSFVFLERWLIAEIDRIYDGTLKCTPYRTGFHCFTEHKYAKMWTPQHGRKIIRVKVRGIHTRGIQGGCKVIVCDEMFVPKPRVKAKTGRAGK